ncbi:unnamed protein product [Blepharisma stoltei]|uniref:Uncharacterized protein n=1 Tax=Blepharisma stoltei TaxID=1481888 RepID=A0AAU9JFN2_9CILI|nr:unnamed protein product [Blepharisma stoltei]
MKLLNPSSIKSKVAKVFYSSECLRRKKSFDQKFLKRLPLLTEESWNHERHTYSPTKYQTARSLIKVSSGLLI